MTWTAGLNTQTYNLAKDAEKPAASYQTDYLNYLKDSISSIFQKIVENKDDSSFKYYVNNFYTKPDSLYKFNPAWIDTLAKFSEELSVELEKRNLSEKYSTDTAAKANLLTDLTKDPVWDAQITTQVLSNEQMMAIRAQEQMDKAYKMQNDFVYAYLTLLNQKQKIVAAKVEVANAKAIYDTFRFKNRDLVSYPHGLFSTSTIGFPYAVGDFNLVDDEQVRTFLGFFSPIDKRSVEYWLSASQGELAKLTNPETYSGADDQKFFFIGNNENSLPTYWNTFYQHIRTKHPCDPAIKNQCNPYMTTTVDYLQKLKDYAWAIAGESRLINKKYASALGKLAELEAWIPAMEESLKQYAAKYDTVVSLFSFSPRRYMVWPTSEEIKSIIGNDPTIIQQKYSDGTLSSMYAPHTYVDPKILQIKNIAASVSETLNKPVSTELPTASQATPFESKIIETPIPQNLMHPSVAIEHAIVEKKMNPLLVAGAALAAYLLLGS